ncbi:MAG: DnaB-like helicase C-terminal domain-containing protein [Planctomycetota bacterium]
MLALLGSGHAEGYEHARSLRKEYFLDEQNRARFEILMSEYAAGRRFDAYAFATNHPKLFDLEAISQLDLFDHLAKLELSDYINQLVAQAGRRELHAAMAANADFNAIQDILIKFAPPQEGEPDSTSNILKKIQGRVKARIREGFPMGIPLLDAALPGFVPGLVYTIGGRTSGFKTGIALILAKNVARTGKKVLFLTYEQSGDELLMRLIAAATGVSVQRMRAGDYSQGDALAIDAATVELDAMYASTLEFSSPSSRGGVIRKIKESKPDLVIIDYLQQLAGRLPGNESMTRKVSDTARWVQKLAKEDFRIPFVMLSQLSRNQNPFDPPSLFSFKESGDIENATDVALLVHFLDAYKYSKGERSPDGFRPFQIDIAKNRDGEMRVLKFKLSPGKFIIMGVDEHAQWSEAQKSRWNEADDAATGDAGSAEHEVLKNQEQGAT